MHYCKRPNIKQNPEVREPSQPKGLHEKVKTSDRNLKTKSLNAHCRPSSLKHLTLAQYCAWYKLVRPARQQATPQSPDRVVLIATPSDERGTGEESILPYRIQINDDRVVQRSAAARPLRWTPHGNFAELMLFKVNDRSTLPFVHCLHCLLVFILGLWSNQPIFDLYFVQAFSTWNELLPFCDEKIAKNEVETVDLAGGGDETRINCVKRLIRDQYVVIWPSFSTCSSVVKCRLLHVSTRIKET